MWDIIQELNLPNDDIATLLVEILGESKESIDENCRRWLREHDRCQQCGELLKYQEYKEYHYELDDAPSESHTEAFCPICDRSIFRRTCYEILQ